MDKSIIKFLKFISEVKVISDNAMLDVVYEKELKNLNKKPTSKEKIEAEKFANEKKENNKLSDKELWGYTVDELTKNQAYLYRHDEHSIPLFPVEHFNVADDNFNLFHFYLEVLKAVSIDIERQNSFLDKKKFLDQLLSEVRSYQYKFISNNHSIIEHIHENKPRNLSKSVEPINFWALMELHKRYFEAFLSHVSVLYNLINLSLENLKVVQPAVKLIWICEKAIDGRAFKGLYRALIHQKYIAETTKYTDFLNVFSHEVVPYEKIIWLQKVSVLHYFITKLAEHRAIQPINNLWMAAINTFKGPTGMDFKYDSLERDTSADINDRKIIDGILRKLLLSKC